MAKDDLDAGAAWARWVNAQFAARHPSPLQLEVAQAAGVGNSAVTKWRKGAHPADADTAVRVAKYFGRPPYEALRAAGHDVIADLLDPATSSLPAPPVSDPVADEIMGWTHLGIKVRQALLEQYRSDLEAALARARFTAAAIKEAGHETS